MSHRINPAFILLRVRYIILGETSRVEVVLTDFLTPILPKIGGELTIEALKDLHIFVSGNGASVASNLEGGEHRHLTLTMTANKYLAQMGYKFLPPQNPGNYPPTMGTAQELALGTERF